MSFRPLCFLVLLGSVAGIGVMRHRDTTTSLFARTEHVVLNQVDDRTHSRYHSPLSDASPNGRPQTTTSTSPVATSSTKDPAHRHVPAAPRWSPAKSFPGAGSSSTTLLPSQQPLKDVAAFAASLRAASVPPFYVYEDILRLWTTDLKCCKKETSKKEAKKDENSKKETCKTVRQLATDSEYRKHSDDFWFLVHAVGGGSGLNSTVSSGGAGAGGSGGGGSSGPHPARVTDPAAAVVFFVPALFNLILEQLVYLCDPDKHVKCG